MPDSSSSNIKKLAASGLRWAILARIGTQTVRWAATIVVIRLLTPDDYGMMAMAMAIISLAMLFNELGVRLVIIRHSNLSCSQIGSLQVFVAALNFFLFMLVVLAAPYASLIYDSDITSVLRACSLVFLTYAIGSVQETLLIRAMNFKKRAYAETTAQLAGSLVSLLLAFLGFGVWSLVLGLLTVRIISALSFYRFVPERYPWRFRYADISPFVGYAGAVSFQRILSWVPTHLIPMTLGIIGSQQALGLYVVGQNLSFLPLTKFGSAFQQVSVATYAKSQDKSQNVSGALQKSLCYLGSIFFPYSLFVIVIAPLAVVFVLGPLWVELVIFIQAMVLALPFRSFNLQLIAAINIIGDTKVGLSMSSVQAILPFTMVIAGSLGGGLVGAGLGWAISVPVAHGLCLWLSRRRLPIDATNLAVSYLRSIGVGIGVVIVILGAKKLLVLSHPMLQLAVLSVIGVFSFALLSLLINRRQITDVYRFIRT